MFEELFSVKVLLVQGFYQSEVKSVLVEPFVSMLKSGELVIYYELEEGEKSSSRGIVEVCPDTHR